MEIIRGLNLRIHQYLLNPHKTGVYCCNFEIPVDDIVKLLQASVDFDKKNKRQPEDYSLLRWGFDRDTPISRVLNDLKEVLTHLDIYKPREPPLGPWNLKKPYKMGITEKRFGFSSILEPTYRRRQFQTYFPDEFLEKDQAVIDNENGFNLDFSIADNVLRLSLIAIKKIGIERFSQFLESIPIAGEKIKKTSISKRFSSRFCYKTYPSAMVVWAYSIMNNPIPSDVLEYFLGAARYYTRSEWRISIVLSAIAVETILAEIYEEIEHEVAPPDTLGALFSKLSKLTKFPNEVENDVKAVNDSRILSVHRASTNIGDREARASLVGATRFAHWSYLQGPLSQ